MFHKFNLYLNWFTTKLVHEVKNDFNNQIIPPTPHIETLTKKTVTSGNQWWSHHMLVRKDGLWLKSSKKGLQWAPPTNIQTCIVYIGTNLSSQLKNIKGPTSFEEQHDTAYYSLCSSGNYNENYISESARRLNKWKNAGSQWLWP